MSRTVLAVFLAALLSAVAAAAGLAAPPGDGATPGMLETLDQAHASAMRQAVGAPSRVDLAAEATVRLEGGALMVPKDPAARLLSFTTLHIPAGFLGLLLDAEGMEAPGLVEFVPSGFVDANEALSWSADDMLASLNDTLEHGNAARVRNKLQPVEARRWIASPRYNPETHQLSWAALVVPKAAPGGSDGEIIYHGVGFGRDGYVGVSVVSSVQKANAVRRMLDAFLNGLNFVPGKAFGDVQPSDRRSVAGLAGAMGLDSLHKAEAAGDFWASDTMIPVVGSCVAAIGALGMVIYIQRHMRRLRRRV